MTDKAPSRIVIADDHPLIRAGVAATLRDSEVYEVVGQAKNSHETLMLVSEQRPHLLVMDLGMEDYRPLNLIQECLLRHPSLKILVLSSRVQTTDLTALETSGIHGFVTKEEGPDSLLQAVRLILEGEQWFSHAVSQAFHRLREQFRHSPPPSLTSRERQVLAELVRAKDNQSIADSLQLSKNSVRRYVTQVFQKLGVKNRMEALVWVRKNGLPP